MLVMMTGMTRPPQVMANIVHKMHQLPRHRQLDNVQLPLAQEHHLADY